MQVTTRFQKPEWEGQELATEVEPRLLLHNSCPDHKGFKSRSDALPGLDKVELRLRWSGGCYCTILAPTTKVSNLIVTHNWIRLGCTVNRKIYVLQIFML